MNKYIRFAVLGAFFIPCKSYWVILAIFMFICFASLVAVGHIHIGGYVEPEQVYAVTVGYITQNNRAMPKDVYIIENGKKRIIPRNNVTITPRGGDNIYDCYCRIKRKDGAGYDYVAAVLKRTSHLGFDTLKISSGREL